MEMNRPTDRVTAEDGENATCYPLAGSKLAGHLVSQKISFPLLTWLTENSFFSSLLLVSSNRKSMLAFELISSLSTKCQSH